MITKLTQQRLLMLQYSPQGLQMRPVDDRLDLGDLSRVVALDPRQLAEEPQRGGARRECEAREDVCGGGGEAPEGGEERLGDPHRLVGRGGGGGHFGGGSGGCGGSGCGGGGWLGVVSCCIASRWGMGVV